MCKCGSKRVADIYGKCSDMCVVSMGDNEHEGYVPEDMGIGGGDDIVFKLCLDCGQIQGDKFPLPPTDLERNSNEDSDFG
jgi:hypothetical protein